MRDSFAPRMRQLAAEWKTITSATIGLADETLEAAELLAFDKLAPLCAEVVQAYPAEFPDPGNPPQRDSGGIEFHEYVAERLTGAASPIEAGRRLVFWFAATVPAAKLRSHPTDTRNIRLRMRRWLVFHDAPAGCVRTWHQPMEWMVAAVEAAEATGKAGDDGKVASSNDARDKWLYEHVKQGTPYKEIIAELGPIAGANRWGKLNSPPSVKRAVQRYCRRQGIAPPPPRHQKQK